MIQSLKRMLRKYKHTGIFTLLFFACSALYSQENTAVPSYTLKQCVETALQNNVDVNRSAFLAESGNVNVLQAKGNMLPFVSGNISHSFNQGRSIDPYTNSYIDQKNTSAVYSLSASVYLWNAHSIQNNIRASTLSYEASKMDLQQTKDNLTIYVILAYLQVLSNQEQLNAAIQQVEVSKKQVERLSILDKEGAIAPATLYDLKGQLADNELNVVTVKNSLETAKLSLFQYMNVPYNTDVKLEELNTASSPVLYDATVDQIYQQALQQLGIIKAADLRKQSADKALLSAKGQLYPSLTLNGGLGTNYSSVAATQLLQSSADVATNDYVLVNNDKLPVYATQNNYSSQKISYGDQWKNNLNTYVGIGLQIPILNALTARSRINQAKITEKKTSFEAQATRIQLRQAIEQAYVNMNTGYNRFQKLNEQVEDFTASFKAAEIKFNAGVGTSVDYLIAKNNLDRSNINLINAKYDYIIRTKVLDYYQSKPLW